MKTLLTVDLDTKLAYAGEDAWAPPAFAFKEDITLGLRFQQTVLGTLVEPVLEIDHATAAIGKIDARPESGTWKLQIGPGAQTADNTTAPLNYDAAASEVQAAIVAKTAVTGTYGAPKVTREDGSWRIVFGTGAAEVPLKVVDNALRPTSFGQADAFTLDAVWQHELRLIQAPVAFTDAFERVLPDPPSVTTVQSGGGGGGFTWNEIQELYVPPDFRGTFILKWGTYARTQELSVEDTADSIQEALRTAIGGANVNVANTRQSRFRIEFVNDLAGTDQPALTVEALNPPPGDVTMTLPLDRAELLKLLRRQDLLQLPLEVRIWTVEAEDATRERLCFRVDVTLLRPLIWPELALIPAVDLLRPPSPRTYAPFSTTPTIVGQKYKPFVVGDGEATEFTLDDGLTTDVVYVFGSENVRPGRQLVQGVDFDVHIVDENSVTVTSLVGAPAANAWLLVVMSAETVAAFADGLTIEIAQVTGLRTELDAIEASVAALLALAPTTPLSSSSPSSASFEPFKIPDYVEVFPGTPGINGAAPKPLGGLLPAIHDSTVTSQTTTVLPSVSAAAENVYVNAAGAELVLAGGMRTKSTKLAVGEFFGSDGRRLIPLVRAGATTSYFPRDFEREPVPAFEVNADMLRAGKTLEVDFQIELALLNSFLTRAQYLLVIEHAAITSETSPATTAPNLKAFAWNATPLLSRLIYFGGVPSIHTVGVEIIRAAGGTLSANKRLYGATYAADSVPASADFGLRARLIHFDTEDSVADPRGAVSIKLTSGRATIS